MAGAVGSTGQQHAGSVVAVSPYAKAAGIVTERVKAAAGRDRPCARVGASAKGLLPAKAALRAPAPNRAAPCKKGHAAEQMCEGRQVAEGVKAAQAPAAAYKVAAVVVRAPDK